MNVPTLSTEYTFTVQDFTGVPSGCVSPAHGPCPSKNHHALRFCKPGPKLNNLFEHLHQHIVAQKWIQPVKILVQSYPYLFSAENVDMPNLFSCWIIGSSPETRTKKLDDSKKEMCHLSPPVTLSTFHWACHIQVGRLQARGSFRRLGRLGDWPTLQGPQRQVGLGGCSALASSQSFADVSRMFGGLDRWIEANTPRKSKKWCCS